MTYFDHYKSGNLVLPAALLFHVKDLFASSDHFLVWQFFYLQNTTTGISELATGQIATALGKTVPEVNQIINGLTDQDLLHIRTIDLSGEMELLFDASPALEKLDLLLAKTQTTGENKATTNPLMALVKDFEGELGRLLTPMELEDLQKTVEDDKTSPDLVRAALREAVLNGKTNWKYINAILRNWRKEGITSLRQLEERQAQRDQANPANVSLNDDFLAAMSVWSD